MFLTVSENRLQKKTAPVAHIHTMGQLRAGSRRWFLFDEPLVLIGEDGAKWDAGDNSAFAVAGKVWVNNHAHVVRPDRSLLSDEWLIYFLNFSDLSEFITGMTVPKLNQAKMREIPIPIPPLEEQKRIVAVLDAAFEGLTRAKENAEANLQNARA